MPRRAIRADVVVIGGGVMGSACAWELSRAGKRVVVLEKSVPGAEASSAAAGILGAHAEAGGPGPMADLLRLGLARHAAWAKALRDETGIDVEYRKSGVLRVAKTRHELDALRGSTAWLARSRGRREVLTGAAVAALEPSLAKVVGAVRYQTDGRVDPRLFFRAIHVAAERSGAQFLSGATVERLLIDGNVATGVAISGGANVLAKTVIVAAGSWSSLVRGIPIPESTVVPVRGQMLELDARKPLLAHVVMGKKCYLVPRDDGRVLVGATVEFVGYEKDVTAGAVRALLSFAIGLVPSLSGASLRGFWSNFRPYTKDGLPLLGRTSVSGLLLATGHYRNGILLCPITAEIVASLVLGTKPPVPLRPFEAARLW